MPCDLDQALHDIARQQLALSHRVAVWCTLAKAAPHDQRTQNAGDIALVAVNTLSRTVSDAIAATAT